MNSSSVIAKDTPFYSSMLGIVRGILVHSTTYPLDVVKTLQQSNCRSEKSYLIASRIFKEGGVTAFYRGLTPQLIRTSIKQAWCWPMITEVPQFISRFNTNELHQQALTGISIAIIDGIVTTPLERLRILSIVRDQRKLSLSNMYKDGWHGILTHTVKLSITWSTFLVAQKYFKDKKLEKLDQPVLTSLDLLDVGVRTAFVVSVISAPFDAANTLKQSKDINAKQLFSGNILRNMYRGWPLNSVSLIINTCASVWLINKLDHVRCLKVHS